MFRSSKKTLALGLTAIAAAAVPGVAVAYDDDDLFGNEPVSTVITYAADGSVQSGPATSGDRAFVAQLVTSGAAGGSVTEDAVGDLLTPLVATPAGTAEYDAPAGYHRFFTRSGFAKPSTARYKRYKVDGTRGELSRRITSRIFRNADGEQVEVRGWAVDIATGKIHKVGLTTAKALSLDPRGGQPNTEYVYQLSIRP